MPLQKEERKDDIQSALPDASLDISFTVSWMYIELVYYYCHKLQYMWVDHTINFVTAQIGSVAMVKSITTLITY